MITEQLKVAPHSNAHIVDSIRLNSLPTSVVTHKYCSTRDYVDSFLPCFDISYRECYTQKFMHLDPSQTHLAPTLLHSTPPHPPNK